MNDNKQYNNIDEILQAVYSLDPSLRSHEQALRNLIKDMGMLRPNIPFNQEFVARLRAELMTQADLINTNKQTINIKESFLKNLFNFNFMNKKIYLAAGSLAVLVLALVAINGVFKVEVPGGETFLSFKPQKSSDAVNRLPGQAFGSLTGLNASTDGVGSERAVALGFGGDSAVASAPSLNMKMEGTSLENRIAGNDASVMDMIIMPIYDFKYSYQGEKLELTETSGEVFRRLKGDGSLAQSWSGLLNGLNIPMLNLRNFRNLTPMNLSVAEDRDQGLMINIDFREEQIYISENWEKWRIMERENCGADVACWERFRIKPSDVPADNELISMANRFLSTYSVNLEHYGEPVVTDNQWREIYARGGDLNNLYIPEYATVIYPLIVNGETVHDQGGGYSGLRVNINLLKKAASGLSGLHPYRYESSSYELETDFSKIIAAAEKGGWNRGYWGGGNDGRTLELGSPTKIYVTFWRYAEGRSEELLVPAMSFPILNPAPEMYYGPRTITVPLVKEMLNELNSWADPVMINGGYGGGVMPAGPMEIKEVIAY